VAILCSLALSKSMQFAKSQVRIEDITSF
jgi:hypothetical protein